MTTDLVTLEDGRARCGWGVSSPEYVAYHDDEWGRPVADERTLFEKLCLEGFQSGLSWLTVLRKRDGFRRAFAGFDHEVVSDYGPEDVERLLEDSDIIRHRGKIEATIANAIALGDLHRAGTTLAELFWSHRPVEALTPLNLDDLAATTAESTALAKELKARGFRFVGPTTAYAAMQAMGVVNDHLRGCWVREVCESERQELLSSGRVTL